MKLGAIGLNIFKTSNVDVYAIDSVPQRAIQPKINMEQTFEERTSYIKQIDSDKANCLYDIPVELLKYGGINVHCAVHSFTDICMEL